MATNSALKARIEKYHEIWRRGLTNGPDVCPGWPQSGVALVGDFAGIQTFVYRPVPGSGGAARRLRSRSFRVSAYTALIARWCLTRLSSVQPRFLYSAGGRFLIGTEMFDNCESHIADLQAQVDSWAWQNLGGELVFHLATAPFRAPTIPHEALRVALDRRKLTPLSASLRFSEGWRSEEFFRPAQQNASRCAACGSTMPTQRTEEDVEICAPCLQDEHNGRRLVQSRFAQIIQGAQGDVSALGLSFNLHDAPGADRDATWLSLEGKDRDTGGWPLLRHVPIEDGRTVDFDKMAERAPGSRKYLGYLRIDVDHAGRQFALLEGHPARTWALSSLLNAFFAIHANELMKASYPNLYAVYGGGDDLFVIGPWTDALAFAVDLRRHLRELAGDDLTFSAGLALAKPREHILSKARESAEELEAAKQTPGLGRTTGRDQVRALGVTCDWETFSHLLATAKQIAAWIESGNVPSRFLHQALDLHRAWREARRRSPDRDTAPGVRYRPLLYYQIRRNLRPGPAAEWAHSLLRPPSGWPWVNFILPYAMLAAKRGTEEE